MTPLRIAGGAIIVLWWLPTIAIALASLVRQRVAFDLRMARVRRLLSAGRLDEAGVALERLKRDWR